jgi:hypothetical protein
LSFVVTGNIEGTVWGTDVYADDSDLAAAAVHAGVLKVGESGRVYVEMLPGQSAYTGSTRNGVTSEDYQSWLGSFRFVAAESAPNVAPPTLAPDSLRMYRAYIGRTLSFEVTGAVGGPVWGTDVYTLDSNLAAAAVHAGVVLPGERKLVQVAIVPGQADYKGSERHGVRSEGHGAWFASFRFVSSAPSESPDAPAPPETPAPAESPPAPANIPEPPKTSVPPAVAPALAEERVVRVWPLTVYQDRDGVYHGSCEPLTIKVGGRESVGAQVGFFESEVGGSGPQWRASGWTAVLTAAELTDFHPRTTRAAFDIRGRIDGPSAGALMTIGVLAGARGDAVRDDATMTGTINPDGMIGPVGGIVHKIQGAADEGKKLVLIPAGIAFQEDRNTGEDEHLVHFGSQLGVEVIPVLDIYTAYRLMTGVELPRAAPEQPHALGPAVESAMLSVGSAWLHRRVKILEEEVKISEDFYTPEAGVFINKAKALREGAWKLYDEGEIAATVHDQIECVFNDYLGLEVVRCEMEYRTRGAAAMIARARNNGWLTTQLEDTAAELRNFEPTNLNQVTVYLEAIDAFLLGASYRDVAARLLANLPTSSEEAQVETARSAALYQIQSWLNLKLAADLVDTAANYRGPPVPQDAPLAELADFYSRAADANVAVFDSLIIEPQAKAAEMTAREVKHLLMLRDEEYAVLEAGIAQVTPNLERYFGPGVQRDCAELAAGMFAYCRAALLVAKYYSLTAELDRNMQVVGLERERTFQDWLDASENETTRNIARVQAQGVEAATCTRFYEIAHILRGRDLPDRLQALYLLFRANVNARVLYHITQVH